MRKNQIRLYEEKCDGKAEFRLWKVDPIFSEYCLFLLWGEACFLLLIQTFPSQECVPIHLHHFHHSNFVLG